MTTVAPPSQAANQYLTFLVNDEEYGLELLRVHETRGYTAPTPIPNVAPYIRGVINLRGTVLPVVDLRVRFGMAAAEYGKFTVIVITNVGSKMLGLLVDAISDVVEVPADAMKPPPDFGTSVNTHFIEGMLSTKKGLAVALDLEKLLETDDINNC